MQRKIYLASFIALLAVGMTACKKSSSNNTTQADYNTELTHQSDDHSQVTNGMDAVDNDINAQIEGSALGRVMGSANIMTLPCDASVTFDTVSAGAHTMTIHFNGAVCGGSSLRREGTIVVSIPAGTHWRDSGAVITETIQAPGLKLTKVSDSSEHILVNGNRTVRNASGGLVENLFANSPHHRTSITHLVNATNMSITFKDGTQRTWNASRKRVFTNPTNAAYIPPVPPALAPPPPFVMTISGNHSDGSNTDIAEWGVNREGHPFTTSITHPLVFKGTCNWRLGEGQITHHGLAATVVVTYGLDASGYAASCPGPTGLYYFKAVWTGSNGSTYTMIHPYY